MLTQKVDIKDSCVYIAGETRECRGLVDFFLEKGFGDVSQIDNARIEDMIKQIEELSAPPDPRICLVLYYIDSIQEMKHITVLSNLNNCGVMPLIPSDHADLTLILLQKTDLKDVEQVPFNLDTLFLKTEKILIRLHMQQRIIESNKKNRDFFMKILRVMAQLLEERDEYTEHHSENVATISCAIAERFDYTPDKLKKLEMAGLLHDFGKRGITDKILNKPSGLTDEEYEIIKRHPSIAQVILEPVQGLEEIIPWIKYHHERYDGKGYPDRIAGKDIPFSARILAVADAYDTMHSKRTYHEPYDDEYILNELVSNKGTQFDPEIVDVFLDILEHEELELITEESS
jgi:HD-GYP domain-containing protein (c-di-GMP phosphodiesterase class II)